MSINNKYKNKRFLTHKRFIKHEHFYPTTSWTFKIHGFEGTKQIIFKKKNKRDFKGQFLNFVSDRITQPEPGNYF